MAYNANLAADLDVTKPDGTVEFPSVLDDAIREVKRAVKNDVGTRLAALEPAVTSLDTRTDALEPRMDSAETRLNNIEPRLAAVEVQHTTYTVTLQAPVSLATPNQWTDVLSLALPAGTYLVLASVLISITSVDRNCVIRITDKTTHYGSAVGSSGNLEYQFDSLSAHTIVTLSTAKTLFVQFTSSGTYGATALDDSPSNPAGKTATRFTAIKLG
jgi:hypothetical protein